MNEVEIQKKIKEFRKKRGWYQNIKIGNNETISGNDLRANVRTDSILKFIPQVVDNNDVVLDIGCNAGLYTLTAAQYCKKAIGLDISDDFIEQANFVKTIWEKNNKKTSNVEFKKHDILEDLKILNDVDIVFACKVLYHKNFVEGIDNFMNALKKSKAKLVFAQGHVTQPRYSNIKSMTELFDKYGFDVTILENIPEYPIVLANRRGLDINKKIKPIKGITRNIEYHKYYDIGDNCKCQKAISKTTKKLDFNEYREVFERCFVEVQIMRGAIGSIRPVKIINTPLENTKFAEIMGINKISNFRVNCAKEFFDLYEKYGEKDFLKKYVYDTEFYKQAAERRKYRKSIFPTPKRQKNNLKKFLRMYENMKKIGNLVPNSRSEKIRYDIYHPEDFPWAINYFGYIKNRDGSHRRMIMHYFGSETIDSIVVDFEKITREDLKEMPSFLYDNFEWFYNEVKSKYELFSGKNKTN